jgi:predicted nucleic acid-binding protein
MPVLFDTSVYIGAYRGGGDQSLILQRWARQTPLWLSAVVLEELYAGAAPSGHRIFAKLERDFNRAGRVLVPNLSDWANVGGMLSRLGQKYGYEQIGKARLTCDALIAASASRTGVLVLTHNTRDFARLAEFCPLQWQVVTN